MRGRQISYRSIPLLLIIKENLDFSLISLFIYLSIHPFNNLLTDYIISLQRFTYLFFPLDNFLKGETEPRVH